MWLYLFKVLSVAFIVFIFLLIVLFGAGANMSNAMVNMPNCPFMNSMASICKMNILEHLAGWQQLFTVPQVFMTALILSMMISLGLLLRSVARLDNYNFLVKRFFVEEGYSSKLFNYLVSAFSSGILHPKIY